MESGNEQKAVGDFNPTVGTKLEWMEKGELVTAYVTEVRKDNLVIKVHGRKGRYIVPKKMPTKAN